MNILYFKNNELLAKQVVSELEELKKGSNVLIPSGSTPREIFSQLVQFPWVSDFNFFALDEWLDIPIELDGSCYSMISDDFTKKSQYPINLSYFLPYNSLEENIQRYSDKLGDNEFDYVILGVGMNGHIGLNEPGVAFEHDYLETELDEVTKRVANKKYFSGTTVLNKGVTVGLNKIAMSKKVIVVINSIEKKEIFQKIVIENIESTTIPAAQLKKYVENIFFYVLEDLK